MIRMDETGVRRYRGDEVTEELAWADLVRVEVVTTSAGPFADDVFWLLAGADGTGVAVPSEQAPEGLLERLQALPGFDDMAVIQAMGSTGDARFTCWERPAG
jgi:hypothetical protein